MTQLKTSELKSIREDFFKLQNKKCEILDREIPLSEMALDHIHGTHRSIFPETNKLVRGLIHSDVNVIIGKIENQWLRSRKDLKDNNNLPDILRKIADYIEKYSKLDNFEKKLIHPSEKPKEKILSKRNFKKLQKEYNLTYPKKKNLEYPKSKKLTKKLEVFYNAFDINPYN
jgi:hypothetical protein